MSDLDSWGFSASATEPGEHWSIDFVSDQLADGRRFKVLTAIDQVSRECVCLEVAQRLPADAVIKALDQAMGTYGQPMGITSDNGTEFTSNVFDQWAYKRGIELDFVAPGRPMDNGFIESFNGSCAMSVSTWTGLRASARPDG